MPHSARHQSRDQRAHRPDRQASTTMELATRHRAFAEVRLLRRRTRCTRALRPPIRLVRRVFGERLRQTNEGALREAPLGFINIFATARKKATSPLGDLGPLYQAIHTRVQGWAARRCLQRVYDEAHSAGMKWVLTFLCKRKALCVRDKSRGTHGFQITLFRTGQSLLPEIRRGLLNEAGTCLAAQGRFEEAVSSLQNRVYNLRST